MKLVKLVGRQGPNIEVWQADDGSRVTVALHKNRHGCLEKAHPSPSLREQQRRRDAERRERGFA